MEQFPRSYVRKCCKYALFLYKNAFFPKKICVYAFFVVPLQSISELTILKSILGGRKTIKINRAS